jgi:hypothetical protein
MGTRVDDDEIWDQATRDARRGRSTPRRAINPIVWMILGAAIALAAVLLKGWFRV